MRYLVAKIIVQLDLVVTDFVIQFKSLNAFLNSPIQPPLLPSYNWVQWLLLRPQFHQGPQTSVNLCHSPHQSPPMRNHADPVAWCDCSQSPRWRHVRDICDDVHIDGSAMMLLEGLNSPSMGAILNDPRTSVAMRHSDSWRQPGPSLYIQCFTCLS